MIGLPGLRKQQTGTGIDSQLKRDRNSNKGLRYGSSGRRVTGKGDHLDDDG
jgi:hypothetical protein